MEETTKTSETVSSNENDDDDDDDSEISDFGFATLDLTGVDFGGNSDGDGDGDGDDDGGVANLLSDENVGALEIKHRPFMKVGKSKLSGSTTSIKTVSSNENDDDSKSSSFEFAALDLTGVEFGVDGVTFLLSEEDSGALEIEKRMLVKVGESNSLDGLNYQSTKEPNSDTGSTSSSAQWQRLFHLAELVTDGKYANALKSPSAQWLLASDNDDDNDNDDDDDYFWNRVQRKLMKIQTVSECVEAEIVAVAAFNLFLQLNYTGPSLDDNKINDDDDKESFSLEGINPHVCFSNYLQSSSGKTFDETNHSITAKRDTKYHNTVLSELSVDGMLPCSVVEGPYLLLLARSILSNLVSVTAKSISLPKSWMASNDGSTNLPPKFLQITSKLVAASMWSARATVAHERLLIGDEPSDTLWKEVQAIFERRCLVDFNNQDEEYHIDSQKFKATIYLEYGLASYYFEHTKKGKRLFDLAKKTSGLSVEVTGSEGKRTKYQQTAMAQMIVRASSATIPINDTSTAATVTTENKSTIPCSDSNTEKVKSSMIDHTEDSPLLENIKYEDANDNKIRDLNVLDQSILLAMCLDVKNTNPADGLTGEEMGAYLARVLHHHDDWIIYSTALLERSWLEFVGNHTKERAILQMQALADQHTNRLTITQSTRKSVEESSPVQDRLRNIHTIVYPPRWQMLADIAERYASLGIVTTAAEIYTEIEYWDEVVDCYRRAGKDSLAVEIVKDRLTISETPRMWMALGDLTNDPAHYEKAIDLSRGRFSMAYIALGKYYYDKGDLSKSASSYKQGLKLRPLIPSVWFRLGTISMKLGDWDSALSSFSEVAQQQPDTADAWSNIAAVHMHNKQPLNAYPALIESLKLNRSNWQMWDNKLNVCLDLEKYDEAVQACIMLLDLKTTHSAKGVPDLSEKCIRAIVGGTISAYGKAKKDGEEGTLAAERRRLTRVHGLLERIRITVNEPWIFETMAYFHHHVGQDKHVFENLMKEYRALSSIRAWERDDYQVIKICQVISQIVDYQKSSKEEFIKSKFLVSGVLKKIQRSRTDIGKMPEEVKSLEKLLENITNEISNL